MYLGNVVNYNFYFQYLLEFDEYCYDECTETGKIVDCAEVNASKICPCQCPQTGKNMKLTHISYEIIFNSIPSFITLRIDYYFERIGWSFRQKSL